MGAAGMAKIVRLNWPWYAIALVVNAAAVVLALSGVLGGGLAASVATLVLIADFWLVTSLVVSHWVYDRSPVSRGAWLDDVDAAGIRKAVVFHGGLNEAREPVARRLAKSDVRTFDFYEASRTGSPSLARARTGELRDAPMSPDRIPLEDGSLDLGLVVFAAHEIRRDDDRAAFFGELARVLSPSGRALVVEHLRDGWNFLAYGPGVFHFLSRATWNRSFADGRMRVLRETPCTRFVRVFELGKVA